MARNIVFGTDSFTIVNSEDLESALDVNKEMYNDTDGGWSLTREFRRAAFIPNIILEKWWNEEGINPFTAEGKARIRKKLNDAEWRYLRTAPGMI